MSLVQLERGIGGELFTFLARENITRNFLENVEKCQGDFDRPASLALRLTGIILHTSPRNAFNNAFEWAETPEGFKFWSDIDELWQDYRIDAFWEQKRMQEDISEEAPECILSSLEDVSHSLVNAYTDATRDSKMVTGEENHSFMAGYLSARATNSGTRLRELIPLIKKFILKK